VVRPCISKLVEMMSDGDSLVDRIDRQKDCIIFFLQKLHTQSGVDRFSEKSPSNHFIFLLTKMPVSQQSTKKVCQTTGLDNIMIMLNKVFSN
jgi:hypothetical protein